MPGGKQSGTVDGYIRSFPPEVRRILEKIRTTVREVVPGAEEVIRYGIPAFRLDGKNLVFFAAFPHHIGFYPLPSGIAAFEAELAPYRQGKGSVQFPLDRPVPYELVGKIVLFRVGEIKKNPGKRGR